MKSAKLGKRTSKAEVTQVSTHGLWVLIGAREYFLDFDQYPWFAKGSIADVTKVQLLHGRHLRWPALDVDIELESLDYPDRYPLVYR
jgi:hypothetical protein